MSNSGGTIVAFLAGAAAGAIVGLLMAPETGAKTRKKLSGKANELMGDIEQTIEANAHKIKEFADTALSEVEKYSKHLSDAAKAEASRFSKNN